MTTSNGRAADSRRSSRSTAQWLLGLLIVLALIASILMVFTDRLSITGSLAVIAALWAAVIGAILVTKFRRQAESAEAKSRDLRLVYELQLEREIAARRQYELDVETTIRKEVTAESNEELSELKAQVLALRSSLEMLLGEPLPDQRVALSSEKMRELASGLNDESRAGRRSGAPYGGGFSGDIGGVSSYGATYADDGVLAARDFAATAPTADDGRHTGPVDPNEMTEVIPVVTDDPISGRIATEISPDEAGRTRCRDGDVRCGRLRRRDRRHRSPRRHGSHRRRRDLGCGQWCVNRRRRVRVRAVLRGLLPRKRCRRVGYPRPGIAVAGRGRESTALHRRHPDRRMVDPGGVGRSTRER